MFDPANDSSYHTLSPADVNTADSQVNYVRQGKNADRWTDSISVLYVIDLYLFLYLLLGAGTETGTGEYCTTPK